MTEPNHNHENIEKIYKMRTSVGDQFDPSTTSSTPGDQFDPSTTSSTKNRHSIKKINLLKKFKIDEKKLSKTLSQRRPDHH